MLLCFLKLQKQNFKLPIFLLKNISQKSILSLEKIQLREESYKGANSKKCFIDNLKL